MPFKYEKIRVAVNRLLGVTPTFDTFNTNPSNPENMTDGDFATETGEGTKSLAGVSGDVGNIYFDLGAEYPPCLLVCKVNIHRDSGDGNINCVLRQTNNIANWADANTVSLISATTVDEYKSSLVGFVFRRYIDLKISTWSVTVNPSVFHVKVAEVQAWQIL